VVTRWWRDHRPAAPSLFDDELKQTTELLSETPKLGMVYEQTGKDFIYRVLLPKTEQHLYYSLDEESQIVIVHTIWGARRGKGPKL
jgi:plasmid stabilization system protein ParE